LPFKGDPPQTGLGYTTFDNFDYTSQPSAFRRPAGHLAFGLQAQSRGCVKLAGVKGWFVEKVVHVEAGL